MPALDNSEQVYSWVISHLSRNFERQGPRSSRGSFSLEELTRTTRIDSQIVTPPQARVAAFLAWANGPHLSTAPPLSDEAISRESIYPTELPLADQKLLERISMNPRVMVGKPVIKGTRLTVEYILNLLDHGATRNEILEEYEGICDEDIQACDLFASKFPEQVKLLPPRN